MTDQKLTVPINPGVGMLSMLRHMNYKPWYALAEFLDNSIQSYISNRELLKTVGCNHLCVEIELHDDETITIKDNAAGIPLKDFHRAFRMAVAPENATGLHEFGMGMKTAATWFAPHWTVTTKALGEDMERIVSFDIDDIVDNEIQDLAPQERPAAATDHYTFVKLSSVYSMPVKKTVGKIRSHISDIYRQYLREDWITIKLNNEELSPVTLSWLNAPPAGKPMEPSVEWRKNFSFNLSSGKGVHGFAGILPTGSSKDAGMSIFRRNRMIVGSADDRYRPHEIFGGGNSFRTQRLVIEVNVEGFDVTHTKDAISWGTGEQEEFLDVLREHLSLDPLNVLGQAEDYRSRIPAPKLSIVVSKAVKGTIKDAERAISEIGSSHSDLFEHLEVSGGILPVSSNTPGLDTPSSITSKKFDVDLKDNGGKWHVEIVVQTGDSENERWLTIKHDETDRSATKLQIVMQGHHPFSVEHLVDDQKSWDASMRIAAALAVAMVMVQRRETRDDKTVAVTARLFRYFDAVLRKMVEKT